MAPISPFDPAPGQALANSNLFILTLVIGGIAFLLVTSLVLYASVRYRSRQVGPNPKQIFGNRRMETAHTAAAALALGGIFSPWGPVTTWSVNLAGMELLAAALAARTKEVHHAG